MTKFKLGLDLDGVLCNNTPFWNIYFNANMLRHHHAIEATEATYWRYYNDICKHCFDDVLHDPKVIKNFVPYDNAVTIYKYLINCFDNLEIRFVTSRPKDVTDVSVEWVYKWFEPKEEGHCHVVQSKKGIFSKENNFDLVVDDSPEQIEDLIENNIPVIIMDRPYNKGIEGIRAYDMFDLEEKIVRKLKGN